MYLITNRDYKRNIRGGSGTVGNLFSDRPNYKGPNELRIANVQKTQNGGWHATLLKDKITKTKSRELIREFNLPLDPDEQYYADLEVACKIAQQARGEKKNILFFVHGFNNDIDDVLTRANYIENKYNVIVVPFSWPANGGGVKGLADYHEDKDDAKASNVALDRFIGFIGKNLRIITKSNLDILRKVANDKYKSSPEKLKAFYARLVEKDCPFTINIMLHSMGNYILKQSLKSTLSRSSKLIFDNIVMVAPDTNNLDHELWIDRLRFRKRLYITINENDHALAASRMKSGQNQLARLGHVLRGLNSRKAHYIDFTSADEVGFSHSYFESDPADNNKKVAEFFDFAFNGKAADKLLGYRTDVNCYKLL